MSMPGVFKAKKASACVLGLFLLCFILFSAFFIAAETGHDCIGEDCPVCASIDQCEKALDRINAGEAVQAAVLLPLFALILSVPLPGNILPGETLISQKIRLNP